MTITAINELPLEQRTAAFFEWFDEWACKGDRVECTYDDDIGSKTYVVFDCTGQPRCIFANTYGIVKNDIYLDKYKPKK